jgi:predicted nucleic acid-binding protein
MRCLVDTNVLLRFANRRDPYHALMRTAIQRLRQAGRQLCITPQNCVEFWNVATRPASRNGFGLTPNDSDRMLRLLERLFPALPEQPATYAEWRQIVVQFNVAGVQVHDARLIAAMRVHTASHILTVNTADFARYASLGITAIDPATV